MLPKTGQPDFSEGLPVLRRYIYLPKCAIYAMERGQVSFEYLISIGFLLAFSGIFFIYSISAINDSVARSASDEFVQTLTGYADFLASGGEGGSIAILADVPDNVSSITLGGTQAKMTVDIAGGPVEFYSYAKVNFTPSSVSTSRGRKKLNMSFNDGNVLVVEG